MKKTKRDVPPPIRWITQALLVSAVNRGGKTLAFSLNLSPEDKWVLLVIETPTPDLGQIHSLLENHAHQVVGQYKTLQDAMVGAGLYLDEWWAGRVALDRCECKEIRK